MGTIVWTNQDDLNKQQLTAVREQKIRELKNACTQAVFEGFESASLGYSFGFNDLDQQNFTQQALLIMVDIENYTDPIQWKTKEGTVETLTAGEFLGLVSEAKTHKEAQQQKYWALELQVNAAVSVEEIEAINW